MEFEPNEIALWLTRLTVGGALAAGLLAVLSAAWPVVRDEWRKGRDRVAKAVFFAAALAGVLYGGAKRATVSYPRTDAAAAYLVDRGSYVTNDYVRIDFERRIVPDDAALVIERRPVASTNDLEWAEYLRTTFAAFSVPTNLPCANATNWNWIVFADWTPPPSVHTNGILEVKWGTSRNDAAHRAAGLAVGIPAQTGIVLGGDRLAVPEARIFTARDYVQDGLVAMWDGIENAGWGVHDGAATSWKDLTGGGRDATLNGGSWGEKTFDCGNNNASFYGTLFGGDFTAEFIISGDESEAQRNGAPLTCKSDAYSFFRNHRTENTWQVKCRGQDDVYNRPTFGPFVLKPFYVVHRDGAYDAADFHDRSGRMMSRGTVYASVAETSTWQIGGNETRFMGSSAKIYAVRIYRRALTEAEIAHNYRVDCARFGLGESALTSATAAPFASAALDALTGAAPALGEAVQGEDPK